MNYTVTVTTAPEATRLTTIDRVKLELDIEDSESDALLGAKLDEATSDIEAHIGRTLSRATLTQTFWGEPYCTEYLMLDRRPVVSVTSVTVDDIAIDASEYRLDKDTGQIYRLDTSGFPSFWSWCKSIAIVYSAGYLLPEQDGRTLPHALEAAAISLVSSYWQSRGRDPLVKSEDVPGLGSFEYWVGSVGESGSLPPDVESKIAPFRRPSA
jgi:uncharacterized phiE125 gp8 family phage protein